MVAAAAADLAVEMEAVASAAVTMVTEAAAMEGGSGMAGVVMAEVALVAAAGARVEVE